MPRKFRIVHLIETLGYGGAERLLCTNLTYLDRDSFDHVVVYLFDTAPLQREIEALGVRCIGLQLRNHRNWPLALWMLRRQLKALAPDLLHTNLVRADIYGRIVGRSLGIPVICTIHESPYYPEVYIDNPGLNHAKYSVMKFIDALTANLCVDKFVVVSRFSGYAAEKYLGIAPSRMQLIYNSLNPELINRAPAEFELTLRQQLGITPGERVIVHVGRLAPQKGHRYLLLAFQKILAVHSNVRLVLRGDGPLHETLRDFSAELGIEAQVTFAKPVPQAGWLLGLSDVFVFPSLHEGLGIALLEAMAMGRPCVASDVGPIPEVVEHGRSGLLVRPGDPDALAEALVTLLQQPELSRRMGERGRQIVREKFDIRQNVRALQALYSERQRGIENPAFVRAEAGS
jgi:glycosyltransferase involved in cell wall biosynthesis